MSTDVKSVEEASKEQGWTIDGEGRLHGHFSSLPNWYGCCLGFDCPRCGQPIEWQWIGKLPGFTTPESVKASGVKPEIVTGGTIIGWGHREMRLVCSGCLTDMVVENWD